MEDKKYCVYIHTNKTNDKKYIGITSLNPSQRWGNGKGYKNQKLFWRAIQKYGWDNFKHDILYNDLTSIEAKNIEMQLILKYLTNDSKFGYNITNGGEGTVGLKRPDVTRRNIKLSHRIYQIDKNNGQIIRIWNSLNECARITGWNRNCISDCCKNKTKQSHGFIWVYYDNYSKEETTNKVLELTKERIYSNSIKVIQLTSNNEYIKEFNSISEAHRELGIDISSIIRTCQNKSKTAGKFKWIYSKNYEKIK